ncbi:LacI family DNA-binding transcriptional regulator [Mycobacterium yunnanensis]|uniref:LacI family DNA-binding transcriptional regulator n=1 Tax=Mycobacterium yunnanensis TaxID=368477 RepID=A0A9X2Z679_9MYCO|nr:LacI family DNA-binding transcriptional regulator [Mycobacterium yunnanensis]MCV7423509.1 LacI family DNA-binding transcriptional regulator [Mycobacterium yunnanensis]
MAAERGGGRVTLRDVALAANVSTTTVSDSLNGNGSLPEKTRQRVRRIAVELGYRPSVTARSLRSGRTGILVITMLPSDVDAESLWQVEYFMRVMAGAAIEANQRGFLLTVAPAQMQLDVAHDGLIAVDPAMGDELLAAAHRRGTPVSTVGRTDSAAASWVDNDWAGVVAEVLDHLQRAGSRRPMLVSPESPASYIHSVEHHFTSWCATRGVASRSVRIPGAFRPSVAHAAIRDILDGPDPPDALFVGLDQLALAAESAAMDLGLRIPQDLMLVNIGDGAAIAHAAVPISVVELHAEDMGRAAVRMLIDQIELDAEPRQEVVPGHLVVRSSSQR